MRNKPSRHPRDVVAKAAMDNAVTTASLVAGEFQATYPGPDWQGYLKILVSWLSDSGGVVEGDQRGAIATFEGRAIAIRFGPVQWVQLARRLDGSAVPPRDRGTM